MKPSSGLSFEFRAYVYSERLALRMFDLDQIARLPILRGYRSAKAIGPGA
jgi:hypothetical protein